MSFAKNVRLYKSLPILKKLISKSIKEADKIKNIIEVDLRGSAGSAYPPCPLLILKEGKVSRHFFRIAINRSNTK